MKEKTHPCIVLNGETRGSFEKMEQMLTMPLAMQDLRFLHENLLKSAPTRTPVRESIERFALLSKSSPLHHEGLPSNVASQLKL